jgi:hypothetical protein
MNPEDVDLEALEQSVLHEVDSYRDEIPGDAALGRPWAPEKVDQLLDEMRAALVKPEWRVVAIRDTFEQVDRNAPERRRCALVADDGHTYELYYDPREEEFVLAMGAPPETIGVRGDPVGCWAAR